MAENQVRTCPVCGRDFFVLADRCQVHCGAPCCRKASCKDAKPARRAGSSTRPCVVCHRPRWMFVRFAPCSDKCTRMHYRSARKHICMVHRPVKKPRIHFHYCSLEHYNDWEKGRAALDRGARRVHYHRHRQEILSKRAFRREKGG